MASVNKVILIGNLGRDPEVRYNPSGMGVANFSVATTSVWVDKQSGVKKEEAEWHRIIVYGGLTDTVEKYFRKGMLVYIEGRLKTRKWQDKNDKEHYITEIIADQFKMLSKKAEPPSDEGSPHEENMSDQASDGDLVV